MHKVIRILMPVAAIALFLASCQPGITYTETRSPEAGGWHYADTLAFTPSVETADTCGIYLWVRHSKQYGYSNLWLKVIPGLPFLEDTTGLVELPLADKSGQWLGQCSQSWCTVRVPLNEAYGFQSGTAFRVAVLQYMREDVLEGIRDVGLEITCP